jgi:hypothetical protein
MLMRFAHRPRDLDRASRPRRRCAGPPASKELCCDFVGQRRVTAPAQPTAATWGLRRSWRRPSRKATIATGLAGRGGSARARPQARNSTATSPGSVASPNRRSPSVQCHAQRIVASLHRRKSRNHGLLDKAHAVRPPPLG